MSSVSDGQIVYSNKSYSVKFGAQISQRVPDLNRGSKSVPNVMVCTRSSAINAFTITLENTSLYLIFSSIVYNIFSSIVYS